MAELNTQLVYAVNRDDKDAWAAMMRICESRPRQGQIIALTQEQFDALHESVLVLRLPVTDELYPETQKAP